MGGSTVLIVPATVPYAQVIRMPSVDLAPPAITSVAPARVTAPVVTPVRPARCAV